MHMGIKWLVSLSSEAPAAPSERLPVIAVTDASNECGAALIVHIGCEDDASRAFDLLDETTAAAPFRNRSTF